MAKLSPRIRVLYAELPGFWLSALRSKPSRLPLPVSARVGKLFRWLRQVRPNLWVLSMRSFFPSTFGGRVGRRLNACIAIAALGRAMRKLRFNSPVLWTYSPFARHLLGRLNERLIVYDCVDDFPSAFYNRPVRALVEEEEAELLRKADLVFVTSEPLLDRKKPFTSNIHWVANAVDFKAFASIYEGKAAPPPTALVDLPRPILGYHGGLVDEPPGFRIDFGLLEDVARKLPDCSLVLIGPVLPRTIERFKPCSNVFFLGPVAYAELPRYIACFDVCMMPYAQNEYTAFSLPLKTHEYMATGKPIVATCLPALKPYGKVIYLAGEHRSFIRAIKTALREGARGAGRRVRLARAHSWDRRVGTLLRLVLERLEPG